jgi:cellulose synthase/poly-beta-1,6-N-acetylglucosamine synthase-like glycosyltransferase
MMTFILFVPFFFVTLAIAYLCVLGIAALFMKAEGCGSEVSLKRFAIVVPAHNEEAGLAATLSSLCRLDYPKHLFQIVVVADNCSDGTASVAKSFNVMCIERRDSVNRGKGYALSFAFSHVLKENIDALVVLDADNLISQNFLKKMSACLARGHHVIQSKNTVKNPLESPLTWILAVGNSIENNLYCAGKARMGLSAPLRGTGMCFSRDILVRFPWAASSVAEDTEYGLTLVENGHVIYFSEESEVMSDAPVTLEMLMAQRIRWASGNMHLARRNAFHLLWAGIRAGKPILVDTGWSMLIRSKPLMFAASCGLLFVSMILQKLQAWSFLTLLMWMAYFGAGIWSAGLSPRSVRLTLFSPFYLVWLVVIALFGCAGFRGRLWARTARR